MLGLYFHIPFCLQKCPYCDFYSLPVTADLSESYPALLTSELVLRRGAARAEPVETIYFGGGTPSLLPPEAVATLLAAVATHYVVAPAAEITLEVNPGTVTAAELAAFRAAGVNRLSIGAQSFDDSQLRGLGRIHDAARTHATLRDARAAGFDDLSLDLIYALPGQSADALQRDLEELLRCDVAHLSCYALTIEPDTPFAARQAAAALTLPDEEAARAAFLTVHQVLSAAGYGHYEISNFARPGHECRHNWRYWRRAESYLGFGAGAHSFDARGWGRRLANPDDLEGYLATVRAGGDPCVELEAFERDGALAEKLYLGLRTAAGVTDEELRAEFGVTLEEAFPQARAKCAERLRCVDGAWRFDLDGWLLFDTLISEFL